jgi:hypothetical protein
MLNLIIDSTSSGGGQSENEEGLSYQTRVSVFSHQCGLARSHIIIKELEARLSGSISYDSGAFWKAIDKQSGYLLSSS